MTTFRGQLPQNQGDFFLTDAGLETDLIFNRGVEIREFAAHTLLPSSAGRAELARYFREYLTLANQHSFGFILDSQTWKAHSHWSEDLKMSEPELEKANRDSVDFIGDLRDEFAGNKKPIVLNGIIGPCGDAYRPERQISAAEAEDYHAQQISWLAATDVDMLTAITFTQAGEAAGVVNAAHKLGMPIVVSFTVETDGALPSGQPLREAISEVDALTRKGAAYFMINCAHPDHFRGALPDAEWTRRIKGLRCNASRCSHAELDEAETIDAGNPQEFGELHLALVRKMPWINVLGGCCGSDIRHVRAIVAAVADRSEEKIRVPA